MSDKQDKNDYQIVQMGRIDINDNNFNKDVNPQDLPILATRNLVLFPGVGIPITLTRQNSLDLAKAASEQGFPVGIVCQIDPEEENPRITKDLYKYGVAADIHKVIELPDGSRTALIRGREKIRILGKGEGQIFKNGLSAKVRVAKDSLPTNAYEFNAVMGTIKTVAKEIANKSKNVDPSFLMNINEIEDPIDQLNFIATNSPCDAEEKIEILSQPNVLSRAKMLLQILFCVNERFAIIENVMQQAQSKMTDAQRNAFLQNQMEVIREELYGDADADSDVENLTKRADEAKMPEYARKIFDKEIGKLQRLNVNTPDYSVQFAYLENLVDLPWQPAEVNTDIDKARSILENTHYGLNKINERILEQLAVLLSSKKKLKAPILCLVGPPGVGKTSLGKTIAEAMGRQYRRVALGGVHDESEIRGHRRTYIGAMPGRIIKAIKDAGTTNPVLLLDEVDKLNHDHRGDPSSALLEVLDPEQNSTFHDNYIDLDYDLSNVLFIATANDISAVDAPLRDRMEIIELSGYLPEEKIEIAKRHLIPKLMKENGMENPTDFSISDSAIMDVIEGYTAESGVRSLEKNLASLIRKMILARLSKKDFPSNVMPEDIVALLGKPKYLKDEQEAEELPGVVTGLAWTAAGGATLMVEASLSPGKGDKINITGNLGDVMKESATIALHWVKAHNEALGIPIKKFEENNIHIHFPEGATPKDGPSAGITIATAIASIFTGRRVSTKLAMTGEITLRGKVLPVGGIREKVLAARRAGVKTIVLCSKNKRDVEEIPSSYLSDIEFKYVDSVSEVLQIALE